MLSYDRLGWLTGVWNPGRTIGTDPADVRYIYTIRRDDATAVTTDRVGPTGAYITSHTLHDGVALFHTGQNGIGAGLPGGRGIKLRYSNALLLDDVAADFPGLTVILARPSVPWQAEAISIATPSRMCSSTSRVNRDDGPDICRAAP